MPIKPKIYVRLSEKRETITNSFVVLLMLKSVSKVPLADYMCVLPLVISQISLREQTSAADRRSLLGMLFASPLKHDLCGITVLHC